MKIKYYIMTKKVFIDKRRGGINKIHEYKKEYKDDPKILEKLMLLEDVLSGEEVKTIMERRGKSAQCGYNWINKWNKEGIEGLKRKKGSGKKRKLAKEKLPELREKIIEKDLKHKKHVQQFIKEEYGINYSERSVSRLLKEMNFGYGKPYRLYHETPENAEEQMAELMKGTTTNQAIIVFGDQCGIEKRGNNVRVIYPIERKNVIKGSSSRSRININGFFTINGVSDLKNIPNSRTFEMCKAVIDLRIKNTEDLELKKN